MKKSLNPLDRPISFSHPRRLSAASEWQQHIPFAMYLVDLVRPRLIVELGTHYGDSYCAFCQAVDELDLEVRCYAVDTWRGDAHTGYYGKRVLENLRAHHDPLYTSFSNLLQSTFDDAVERFRDGSIDLLHIDGFHTYEAVRHDFHTWRPKLSDRGVVLLHDTAEHGEDFGVWKLWEELRTEYPHLEFTHGHGLGVVGIGKSLPAPVRDLLEVSEAEADILRRFFERVGAGWSAEHRFKNQVAERRAIEQHLVALLNSVEDAQTETEVETSAAPLYGRDAEEDTEGYQRWLHRMAREIEASRSRVGQRLKKVKVPLISVVVPLYKPHLHLLKRAVGTVRAQILSRWELCLCDDGSGSPELEDYLTRLARSDRRIKVTFNETNRGISNATNAALSLVEGEFVAFMDQDDELEPEALAECALLLAEDREIDILYTDEDKIDEFGRRYAPFFKPDWSPDYLLSCMYTGHLSAMRKSLVEDVGGLRPEFDGSQDHDLMLRVSEQARKIVHIPKVLYHWRAIEGSAAASTEAKPWAYRAGVAAVQSALERRGEEAVAEPGAFPGARKVKRAIKGSPKVGIVIPFRDMGAMLERLVLSIEEKGGYRHWEAVLIDNGSWEPETIATLKDLAGDRRFKVVKYRDQFNWSVINNFGALQTNAQLLLFLNNDVEGISDGWLESMVEHAQRPEVGAVGARLLYPTGHLQHAGVIIGCGGIAGHAFRYCPPGHAGYFGLSKVIRNVSAVTGACMMVRREVFEELGGFDPALRVAFNDIDFCLRLQSKGYSIVYTPYAELIHFESLTRGEGRDHEEIKIMLERWLSLIKRPDPYYNPNLSLRYSEFRIRDPDEHPPWQQFLWMLEKK